MAPQDGTEKQAKLVSAGVLSSLFDMKMKEVNTMKKDELKANNFKTQINQLNLIQSSASKTRLFFLVKEWARGSPGRHCCVASGPRHADANRSIGRGHALSPQSWSITGLLILTGLSNDS